LAARLNGLGDWVARGHRTSDSGLGTPDSGVGFPHPPTAAPATN